MLHCAGEGSPTVVILPGGGSMEAVFQLEPPIGWSVVFSEVSKSTHVCAYDRAGIGRSDAVAGPPITSAHVAADLRALLTTASVPEPYVLAGNSFGGMNARAYAHLYPATVAGMVLVDSSHPDQYPRFAEVLPPSHPEESPILAGLRDGPSNAGVDFTANANLIRATNGLGNKPLIILTRSPDWPGDDFVDDDWEALVEPVWQELQAGLTALSSDSRQVVSQTAGHNIQFDEPELVSSAILEIVEQLRDRE